MFVIGKPEGWKEKRTEFGEKGILWFFLIFSRGEKTFF